MSISQSIDQSIKSFINVVSTLSNKLDSWLYPINNKGKIIIIIKKENNFIGSVQSKDIPQLKMNRKLK